MSCTKVHAYNEDIHPLIARSRETESLERQKESRDKEVRELLRRLSEIRFPADDITTKSELLFRAQGKGIQREHLMDQIPVFFQTQTIKKLQSFINSGQAYIDFIQLLDDRSGKKNTIKLQAKALWQLHLELKRLPVQEKQRYLRVASALEAAVEAARKYRDQFGVDPAVFRKKSLVTSRAPRAIARSDIGRNKQG